MNKLFVWLGVSPFWYLINLAVALLAGAAVRLAPEELKRIFLILILMPTIQVQNSAAGLYLDRLFKVMLGGCLNFFAVAVGYFCASWLEA